MRNRQRSFVISFILALIPASCSDAGAPSNESDPPETGRIDTLMVTAPHLMEANDTMRLSVIAKDKDGNVVPVSTLSWTSSETWIAKIGADGTVIGRGVGYSVITVRETPSGVRSRVRLDVGAPPRPAGSLVTLGIDSVYQYGSYVYVASLVVVDTSVGGGAYRLGIVRRPEASFDPPILRAQFPAISAIAECPNGEIYATNYSDGWNSLQLWRIDGQTGLASRVSDFYHPGAIRTMTCANDNSLYLGSYFGGFSEFHHVSRTGGTIPGMAGTFDGRYMGVAMSPAGTLYAHRWNENPSDGAQLVTINSVSGLATPVAAVQLQFPRVREFFFRGNRLIGFTGSEVVRIDLGSGQVTTIRSVIMP